MKQLKMSEETAFDYAAKKYDWSSWGITVKKSIFVFGSNLAGRHGAGSAQAARLYHGAIYGQGTGLQGRSYAIPTKDENFNVLPVEVIKKYVDEFKEFAKEHPDMVFNVVAIGCGYAGYQPKEIAPLFEGCSPNVNLPSEFLNPETKEEWWE